MTSHGVGGIQGTRQGCYPVFHAVPILFSDATAVRKAMLVLPGTTLRPLAFKVKVLVDVVSNAATSHAVLIDYSDGSVSPATLIAAGNIKTTGASIDDDGGADEWHIIKTTNTIYLTPTIVGTPTAGRSYLMVQIVDLNVNLVA